MSSVNYGRNDSITFVKSPIMQTFKDNKSTVSSNRFMSGLCKPTPEPGMLSYPALLNYMPEAMNTNPKYSQPENITAVPPTQIKTSKATVDVLPLGNNTLKTANAASSLKPSVYDMDSNSILPVGKPLPTSKSEDIPANATVAANDSSKIKPSNYDVNPNNVKVEESKEISYKTSKEDLSFLHNA